MKTETQIAEDDRLFIALVILVLGVTWLSTYLPK